MNEIGDALTSVRKRDWRRLVRDAANGRSVLLSDPELPRPVLLAPTLGPDEYVGAVTHHGPTRGTWATGRAAGWLRGQAWVALGNALLPPDRPEQDVAGDVVEAIGWLLPADVPLLDTDDLTAVEGRRLLAGLADTARDTDLAVMVRAPGDPAAVVMLASQGLWRVAAPVVTHEDGPDSRAVRAGLWLSDVAYLIADVGHHAWVAEQSGRPWSPIQAADRVLARVHRIGLPAIGRPQDPSTGGGP